MPLKEKAQFLVPAAARYLSSLTVNMYSWRNDDCGSVMLFSRRGTKDTLQLINGRAGRMTASLEQEESLQSRIQNVGFPSTLRGSGPTSHNLHCPLPDLSLVDLVVCAVRISGYRGGRPPGKRGGAQCSCRKDCNIAK